MHPSATEAQDFIGCFHTLLVRIHISPLLQTLLLIMDLKTRAEVTTSCQLQCNFIHVLPDKSQLLGKGAPKWQGPRALDHLPLGVFDGGGGRCPRAMREVVK
ncbi:UNVERIFIED_CONTAM: hypothetical protein K2H54_018779 [Gekko kuhli]